MHLSKNITLKFQSISIRLIKLLTQLKRKSLYKANNKINFFIYLLHSSIVY